MFKLGDLSVIFAKRFNMIIEGDGAASVRIPPVEGCYLGTIVDIMSEAVQKRGVVYPGAFLFLAELMIVFVEGHRALFKLITKVNTGIFFFVRISAKVAKFLPPGGKGSEGVNTVFSVLPYKTISLLSDSQSGFGVCNLIAFVGEPVVVCCHLL